MATTEVCSPSKVRVIEGFQEVARLEDEVDDGGAKTLTLDFALDPCREEGGLHFKEMR